MQLDFVVEPFSPEGTFAFVPGFASFLSFYLDVPLERVDRN
jgi:hypothetical protein